MKRPAALLLAAIFPACEAEEANSVVATTRAPEPTPYTPDVAGDETGDGLSELELEQGLDEAIAYLHRLDARMYHDIWTDQFWTHADDLCPSIQEHNGMDYWNDRCTSRDGTEFRGWILNFRGFEWQYEPGVWMVEFAWLSGHAVLTFADGSTLSNFGDVMYQHSQLNDGKVSWQGQVFGDFWFTGPDGVDTWVQAETTNVTDFHYTLAPGGRRTAWFNADMAWFEGPVAAVRLEDVFLSEEDEGCAAEPLGRVRVRDEDGRWYEVTFDPETTCDGCGTASLNGQELGQVCIDTAPLFDWPEELWPWAL
jgi:hypothetical protein